jgi:hypothetical protein
VNLLSSSVGKFFVSSRAGSRGHAWTLCGAAALACLGVSRPASAEGHVTLAAELGVDAVMEDTRDEDLETLGVSAAARLGYMVGNGWIRVTPELKVGFESPGTPNSFSIKGGARLNLLDAISPAVFAHMGGLVGDMEGFVWDIGVGLDFRIVPHFDIGAFAAYNQAGGTLHFLPPSYQSSDWEWLQFGGQAAIHF